MTSGPDQRWLHAGALIGLLLLSIFFWNSIVLYPVKLFVVLLHETSHGIAAIATGGSIDRIEIDSRIGGMCYTSGGWQFGVVSSGYIGSMILGGAVFLAALRRNIASRLALVLSVCVTAVTVLFVRNIFGFVFGILFAGLLFSTGFLPIRYREFALQYLGAISCLYALIDTKEDVLTLEKHVSDAAILAGMTGIPAIVWGILWSVIALAVFVFVLRLAWKHIAAQGSGGAA